MTSYIQLLGLGGAQASFSSSAHIFLDTVRALINCGEGTQRIATEHKLRLSKLDRIYLTRIDADTIGGLPGLLLTLHDVGCRRLTIYGPSGTSQLLWATRHFIHKSARENINTSVIEWTPSNTISSDKHVSVEAVILATTRTTAHSEKVNHKAFNLTLQQYQAKQQTAATAAAAALNTFVATEGSSVAAIAAHSPRPPSPPRAESHDRIDPVSGCSTGSSCVSYIYRLPAVVGKFDAARAKELKIPVGPFYAQLKAGMSVTFDIAANSKTGAAAQTVTVQPTDIVKPTSPGSVVAVIDVPKHGSTDAIVRTLITHTAWAPYQQHSNNSSNSSNSFTTAAVSVLPFITVMLHMASLDIVHADDYQAWMRSFGPVTQHIIYNSPTEAAAVKTAAAAAAAAATADLLPSSDMSMHRASSLHIMKLQLAHANIFKLHQALHTNTSSSSSSNNSSTSDKCSGIAPWQMSFPSAVTLSPEQQPYKNNSSNSNKLNLVSAQPLLKYNLLPLFSTGLDYESVLTAITSDEVETSLAAAAAVDGAQHVAVQAAALRAAVEAGEWTHRGSSDSDNVRAAAAAAKAVAAVAVAAAMTVQPRSNDTEVIDMTDAADDAESRYSDDDDAHSCSDINSNSNSNSNDDIGSDDEAVQLRHIENQFTTVPVTADSRDTDFVPTPNVLSLMHSIGQQQQQQQQGRSSRGLVLPALTFLGTGSAIPCKYRNVTAMLLQCGKDSDQSSDSNSNSSSNNNNSSNHYVDQPTILLDCGEGTYEQLCRKFGDRYVDAVLLHSLTAIFISHMHADHHLGLLTVLQRRAHLQSQQAAAAAAAGETASTVAEPLLLIGPQKLWLWLQEYVACAYVGQQQQQQQQPSHLLNNVRFIVCSELTGKDHSHRELLNRRLNASAVRTVFVRHCHDSFGLVIEHQAPSSTPISVAAFTSFATATEAATAASTAQVMATTASADAPVHSEVPSWKLVYSGDTMPSQSLIAVGADATLLIHEATFSVDMIGEAHSKRHCTTTHAIAVGHNMNANAIVLSHFSQRYPKLPNMEDKAEVVGYHSSNNSGNSSSNSSSDCSSSSSDSNHFERDHRMHTKQVGNVSVAFDLMSISFSELLWLPVLAPLFDSLFPSDEVTADGAAATATTTTETAAAAATRPVSPAPRISHKKQKTMRLMDEHKLQQQEEAAAAQV